MTTNNSINAPIPIEPTKGGTGQSTYVTGDILYASAPNVLSKLPGNTTSTPLFLSSLGNGTNNISTSLQPIPAPTLTCGFSATLSGALSNATGDGTLVSVICDTTVFDIGGNYNNSTGIFTAPANGTYVLGSSVFLSNLSASHTQYLMYIVANGVTYMMSQGNPANEKSSVSNQLTRRGEILVQLNSGQTAQIQVEVDGTSKTATIGAGGQPTSFYGYIL